MAEVRFPAAGDAAMKAVMFHGVGDIRLDDVADPKIFGGPSMTGPFNGLQAEYALTPFAASSHIKARGRGWTKVKLEPGGAA